MSVVNRSANTAPWSACTRCGAAFVCGVVAGTDTCWCAAMPHLQNPDYNNACMCQACLRRVLEQQEQRQAAGLHQLDLKSVS